ncbi:class III extradiol ring-cleavage dioxygenase [Cupriavidus sp. AU9028]|uniref:DODA-type extradiol aromatic ring-opening family dioxygenase n=1 Tax=Cupriavidus sp. AU9028 TaxID=2871157 RepID=UPI0021027A1A|nr:class III extradiol ring-cleavage dioxygenase [Cupriavidus sp. AU9028]
MPSNRLPVYFVSHGGGPWPFIDGIREQYAATERALRALPDRLPARPAAVLVISGHWEAPAFTVSTAARPPMLYDYFGFPPHTYHLQYPAPGAPALAARVHERIAAAGLAAGEDAQRGFDHGTFIPLGLMFPDADVPVLMVSLRDDYDPAAHLRLGQALAPLRDEGVLIIGSGLTYHNMRGFNRDASTPVAEAFQRWLDQAVTQPDAARRNALLADWQRAPDARLVHPREDHLMPLLVAAGAAGNDAGRTLFVDRVMKVPMASYEFRQAVDCQGDR